MDNADEVLWKFVLGASRAGFLTMLILVAGYWSFILPTLIIMSLIGGYMTVHQK